MQVTSADSFVFFCGEPIILLSSSISFFHNNLYDNPIIDFCLEYQFAVHP